jgi:hypothetical protein
MRGGSLRISTVSSITARAVPEPRRLLDTTVVIDLPSIDPDALPDESAISTLTLAELVAGPHVTAEARERSRRWMAVSAYVQTSVNTKDLVIIALNRKPLGGGLIIESKQVQLTVTPGQGWKPIQGLANTKSGAFIFKGLPVAAATYEVCFIFSPKSPGQLARLDLDGISAFGYRASIGLQRPSGKQST